jgi:peptidoglycan LD-endopeptidase LytH
MRHARALAAAATCLAGALAGCSGAGSPAAGPSPPLATGATPIASPTASPPSAIPSAIPSVASPRPTPARRPTSARPRAEGYVYPVQRCGSTYSTSHHDYPASDIFTQKGCAFVAVTSGRVDEVSFTDRWDPQVDSGASRGGRSVSVIGDDGVRYYGSHLLRIAPGIRPGARVAAGQLLGLIDNSGDAKYTATHVHFGLSWPTRPGVWWVRRGEVWPQRYLAAWRAGHNVSPAAEVRATEHRMGRTPPCQAEC